MRQKTDRIVSTHRRPIGIRLAHPVAPAGHAVTASDSRPDEMTRPTTEVKRDERARKPSDDTKSSYTPCHTMP
jgi:hypothetical protein